MMTAALNERFSRDAAAGYDRKVIERANVILAGTGALGQFLALCLALIGYVRVTFIDMDVFEESNATRSPFYRQGAPKALATAQGAARLCTATGPIDYRYGSTQVQRFGDAIFEDATAVLCAVDCQLARGWLAQRCRLHGVPLIEGGFRAERWNISTFPNGAEDEPCWACGQQFTASGRVFSCDAYARAAEARGVIPATAPGAMSLAAAMAGQLTQTLHGNSDLANTTLAADLRRGVLRLIRRTCDPYCMLEHRIARDIVDVPVTPDDTVAALLAAVEQHVRRPLVGLPAAFIRTAACRACHQLTVVLQPEWALSGPPLCRACGGANELAEGVPEQHGYLAPQTSAFITDLPLRQLGLGPRLLLRVEGDQVSQIVRIGGERSPLTSVSSARLE